jgi:CPA2 family monovalent cation:H+ antiporter-2
MKVAVAIVGVLALGHRPLIRHVARRRSARETSMPASYADSSEPSILDSMYIASARLVVITHNDLSAVLKTLSILPRMRLQLPVLVRSRDDSLVEELKAAGALEVVPESLTPG